MEIGLTRRALAAGALAAAACGGTASAAETGRWRRIDSPRFQVFSNGPEADQRAFTEQLEGFDWALRMLHGLDPEALPPRRLTVILLSVDSDLRRLNSHLSMGVRGFYTATMDDIFAVTVREKVDMTKRNERTTAWGGSYLFHEYTHHFMLQYFPYAYPPWLVEGYAEYYATVTIDGPVIEVGKFNIDRVEELRSYDWLPMETVLGKPLSEVKPEERSMFYAQAWWLTFYLKADPIRARQLNDYVLTVGKGEPWLAAARRIFGMEPKDLERALRIALSQKVTWQRHTRTKPLPPAAFNVTALPASYDDLFLEHQHLKHGVYPDETASLLSTIRSRARQHDDLFARLVLARAELYLGDAKAAQALLDTLIRETPDNVEVLELRAEAGIKAANAAKEAKNDAGAKAAALEAQVFVGRAHKLDPTHYPTLWSYVLCRKVLEPTYPSPNTLEVVLTALDYAPQVPSLRLEAARALLTARRLDEAEATIAPLLGSPHAGETTRKAARAISDAIAEARKARPASP